MPKGLPGNISGIERLQRLFEIKRLQEEGKSDSDITGELGISLPVLRRSKKWLGDLAVADLTSKEIGEKRAELYLELTQAASEAQELFEKYRDENESRSANTWMIRWIETIKVRSLLYGLDTMKVGPLMQINQTLQYAEPEMVDHEAGERITKLIKARDDKRRRDNT